jgi:hypothetical protein
MTVACPIAHTNIDPQRITDILRHNGYTFDAVKARLGTEYRMWAPQGAGIVGQLRAFGETISIVADIGSRMLSSHHTWIGSLLSNYFIRRGPKTHLDLLIWLFFVQ